MAVHLCITPVVSQIRIYDQPNGYDARVPYVGIVTVTYLTDKKVLLGGAVGSIDRSVYDAIKELLTEEGIEEVIFERRSTMKSVLVGEERRAA